MRSPPLIGGTFREQVGQHAVELEGLRSSGGRASVSRPNIKRANDREYAGSNKRHLAAREDPLISSTHGCEIDVPGLAHSWRFRLASYRRTLEDFVHSFICEGVTTADEVYIGHGVMF